jgi:hypothetical protein
MTAALQSRNEIVVRSGDGSRATEIRGSLLVNGFAILRAAAREDAYFAALPAALHGTMRSLVAHGWVPMELATAHYLAMERVFPSPQEQRANGRNAAEKMQNGYVHTVVKGLRSSGADYMSPALERVPSVLDRVVRGGNCTIYRSGFKDARIELDGYPFLASRYVHNGWHGMFESSFALISRRIFVRSDVAYASNERMALLFSWV